MTAKHRPGPQLDLFIPYIADLPLRDTRETMERPFFSLAKRKRLKPIEYTSPDGTIYVKVFATPQFGMATIWDADILIWASSTLNNMRNNGCNDLPRTLNFQAYDVLKTIGRATGGRDYQLLRDALGRLQATTIKTNIRPKGRKKERQFSWIESWSDLVDENTGKSLGMSLTVSDWFYEGILMDGGLLAIDPLYFSISGGRERWLYRVARKHAGAAGPAGFAIPLPTLFEKSGAEGTYRRFKFEMLAIADRNDIPGFELRLEAVRIEPAIRMIRKNQDPAVKPEPGPAAAGVSRGQEGRGGDSAGASLPPLTILPPLSEQTIGLARRDFPGLDVYAIKGEYDAWLADDSSRMPKDYQRGFYGFARKLHARYHA
jgi:plasmid replication initiation protein